MSVSSIFLLLVSSILINNFVLSRILGICPFIGVSKQVETAFGMGLAVTFVMGLASIITYMVYELLLVPLDIVYMETIAFILIIAALVQFVEMVIAKSSPSLYQALGVYLPLITTNCAVLGVTLLNIQSEFNILEVTISGVGGGIGFSLAIILFAAIREKLEVYNVPKAFKGFPIALITASLMSLAFMGFAGLV